MSFTNGNALLTPDQMARADALAIAAGATGISLMEAAGKCVAQAICARWAPCSVLIACGTGNNGGDGFVVARHLAARGWPVRVGLLGMLSSITGEAAHHARQWSGLIEPLGAHLLNDAMLLVDALFGAGLSRPVQGPAAQFLMAAAQRNLPVCAVDLPSGVDGNSGEVLGVAIPAALTVTFFRKKPAHILMPGKFLCGDVIVGDIGISASVLDEIGPATYENDPAMWLADFPWPRSDGHKYSRGHVMVLGGPSMTGAARLTAAAAARAGAGLVTLAAPAEVWSVYASALTSIMVSPFSSNEEFAQLLFDQRKNVVVVGPGAGASTRTRELTQIALRTHRAVVLDADALTSFRDDPQALFSAISGPCVLTPHEGEFDLLFSCTGSKLERARSASRISGAVVLLKGADTVIAAPDGSALINGNAPPELATGGTGDVLAGFIAALMAQGMNPFQAAGAAAWLHGEAARHFGPGLIADDLPAMLPAVLRELKAMV